MIPSDERIERSGSGEALGESDLPEHPIGTLAIVAILGVLYALGWFALWFFVYLPRGGVTP